MDNSFYKKILEARIADIRLELDSLKNRLDNESITYFEYLYLESNLYNNLIKSQHELNDLERAVLS